MGTENNKLEPTMDNMPKGIIDWAEISNFIEDMLNSNHKADKGWKTIKDASMTNNLKKNSILVLNTLYDDLYCCFYKQHGERYVIWNRMEEYIKSKYRKLSKKALSEIISTYHIDDR